MNITSGSKSEGEMMFIGFGSRFADVMTYDQARQLLAAKYSELPQDELLEIDRMKNEGISEDLIVEWYYSDRYYTVFDEG